MATKSIKNKKHQKASNSKANINTSKPPAPNKKEVGELNTFDKCLIWIVEWWEKRKMSTKLTIIVCLLLLISFICLTNALNTNGVNINNYVQAIMDGAETDTSLIQDFVYSLLLVLANSFLLIVLLIWKVIVSLVLLMKPEYTTLVDTFKEAKNVRLRL